MDILQIKSVLKERKITYEKLSSMSGVPKQTLQKIFAGYTEHPRIDTLQAIEKALGITEGAVDNSVVLTDEELRLLSAFRRLVPSMQEYILGLIEGITGRENADEKKA